MGNGRHTQLVFMRVGYVLMQVSISAYPLSSCTACHNKGPSNQTIVFLQSLIMQNSLYNNKKIHGKVAK